MREVVNMASIPEKKAVLSLSDGASVNLNKPIDIPSTITDISQITEPGWYHGKFTYSIIKDNDAVTDTSNVKNTPAIKIKDTLTVDTEYNFDMFVTKTGDYIFNLAGYLFYGPVSNGKSSIEWKIVSPLVKDWLDSEDTESALSANCGRLLKEELDTKSPNTHVHDHLSRIEDNRDTATKPSDYADDFKFIGIKKSSIIGFADGTPYASLIGFNAWSDSSGIGSVEIAVLASGEIYMRKQAYNDKTDSFGDWKQIITSVDVVDNLRSTSTTSPLSANQGNNLDKKKLDKPTVSTTDLEAGTSKLANGQLYLVYE